MTELERKETVLFIHKNKEYEFLYYDLLSEGCQRFHGILHDKYSKTLVGEAVNTGILCFFNHIRKLRERATNDLNLPYEYPIEDYDITK